ncbi:hypothetical protein C4580_01795 [Candidatus Woesearchaeota archaeon]|nr:MAG: hypothetical protein C4580_01795 [Candidatus Woesearchaeota archaeon]
MDEHSYKELQKKHTLLPEWADINREFEICTIDTEHFPLRMILRKMAERIEPVLEILERAITPDPNRFTDMYECRCISNGDKKQLLDVFRHLMEHHRLLLEADLTCEEKTELETIRKVHDLWLSEKKHVIGFVKKLRACWQKHVEPKELLDYLG